MLTYNYSAGLNDTISRLSSLSDSTGTLEAYSYLGLGTVVIRSHPQINVSLTMVGTPGDAGDKYAGLDRFARVVDQLWKNTSTSTVTDDFQYGYDRDSNRLFRDNLVNTAFGELYSYDGLNQLASFARGTLNGTRTAISGTAARTQAWDYDALGNFDSVTTNGSAQTRTANAQNEITSISGATTPTYDANGNMTGDETGLKFVYDAWNRLVAVKNSAGTVTLKTYSYDGLNRRVAETVSGTTTDLYYSAAWQVLEEKVGANTTKRYVWSPVYVDAMVLRDRDTDGNGTLDERLWVQQDANWNVTALVNSSGVVVERYAYDAFGVVTVMNASWTAIGSSAYAWQYLHQGGRLDGITGSYYLRNRDYSPTLGRWTSLDPIRYSSGDINHYGFAGENPVNHCDPSGLITLIFGGAGAEETKSEHVVVKLKEYIDDAIFYFQTPGPFELGKSLVPLLKDAQGKLDEALKKNCSEQITLIGYSRGGVYALAFAHKLNNVDKKKVTFLGMVDPSPSGLPTVEIQVIWGHNYPKGDRRLGELNTTKALIPANVKRAFVTWADPEAKKPAALAGVLPLFGVKAVDATATTLVEKKYPGLDHFQVGQSDDVLKDMLKQLADAGVPLKKK